MYTVYPLHPSLSPLCLTVNTALPCLLRKAQSGSEGRAMQTQDVIERGVPPGMLDDAVRGCGQQLGTPCRMAVGVCVCVNYKVPYGELS